MMKLLKKYKLRAVFVLAVMALLIHFHFGYSFIYRLINSNSNSSEAKRYLQRNCVELAGDVIPSIPSLDSSLEKNKLFLVGESHGVGVNQPIQFMFLKYFREKGSAKYMILEFPPTFAAKINSFFTSGDTLWLDSAFSPLKGTFAWTTEYLDFFKDIHEYNSSFSDSERIKCVGIDVEHQSGAALYVLKGMLPDQSAPKEIEPMISKLRSAEVERSDYRAGWKIATELIEDLNTNSDSYEGFLGDNYFEYSFLLGNIINGKRVNTLKKEKGRRAYLAARDSVMYDNMMLFHKNFPDEKAFGFWGTSHIYREEFQSIRALGAHLEQCDSPYRGRVLSIHMNYQNCRKINRGGNRVTPLYSLFPNGIFDFYKGENPTLYNLDRENSPFHTFRFSPLYKSGTTKLFQYLLLIKNSDASTPLSEQL